MIEVEPKCLAEILRLLRSHVPECEVRAFGSRVNGCGKKYSDLDLAVVGDGPLDWRRIEALKNAFSESDLPFLVDVLDWHAISPEFQQVIEKEYEVVQGTREELEYGK